jgi:hypothetical protein
MNTHTKGRHKSNSVVALLWLVVLSPLWIPLVLLCLVLIFVHLLAGLFLYLTVWCCWCTRGRHVLFIYSDSPIWHDYVEVHMLPKLGGRAIILNWSERKRWRRTLPVLVFRYFGGYRSFNPMALVFRPFRLVREFRFYEPFKDFKHGNTEALVKMEAELYKLLAEIPERRTI